MSQLATCATVAVALLAFFAYPVVRLKTEAVDLDDIERWGLKGPAAADPTTPFLGVYLVRGLNPIVLFDTSYGIKSWDPESRVLDLHLHAPGMTIAPKNHSDESGSNTATSLSNEAGDKIFTAYTLGSNSARYYFDADLRTADLKMRSCYDLGVFGRSWCNPLSLPALFTLFVRFEQTQKGNAWARNNYYPRANTTRAGGTRFPAKMQMGSSKIGDGYMLLPVMTLAAGGRVKVHRANLNLAKKKLQGQPAFRIAV